jgi:hypothetical protein
MMTIILMSQVVVAVGRFLLTFGVLISLLLVIILFSRWLALKVGEWYGRAYMDEIRFRLDYDPPSYFEIPKIKGRDADISLAHDMSKTFIDSDVLNSIFDPFERSRVAISAMFILMKVIDRSLIEDGYSSIIRSQIISNYRDKFHDDITSETNDH